MTSVVYFALFLWSGLVQCREKGSNVDVIFMLRYVYKDTNKYPPSTVFIY